MTSTNVDYAKDEINELVDGMASGNPERPQEIKAGLMKIVSDRTFAVAAEAACFWIGHWRMVADTLEVMAQRSQDARVGDRERWTHFVGAPSSCKGTLMIWKLHCLR